MPKNQIVMVFFERCKQLFLPWENREYTRWAKSKLTVPASDLKNV